MCPNPPGWGFCIFSGSILRDLDGRTAELSRPFVSLARHQWISKKVSWGDRLDGLKILA